MHTSHFVRAALLSVLAFASGTACHAAGSSVSRANQYYKIFREVIIEGARPEISACLTIATVAVSSDTPYQKLEWSDESTLRSIVNESYQNDVAVRDTTITALGLVRDESVFHLDTWDNVVIRCHQVGGAKPEVRIDKFDRS